MALLRNRIEPKIENILRKNQNGFRRNRSRTSQILAIRWILKVCAQKKLEATILFVDFTKVFDSIHRGKIDQILLEYCLRKDTVAAIMMLYRNTKVKVRSPVGDTDYFDIVAGVLQGYTLAPYLFIICLDEELRKSIDKIKENGFKLIKERSRRYHLKQLSTPTTPMIYRFWHLHPPKPKPCCIVWNEPLQASASMSVHTKGKTCALIKQYRVDTAIWI